MKKSDQKIRQKISFPILSVMFLTLLGLGASFFATATATATAADDFTKLTEALENLKPRYENCRNCNVESNELFKLGQRVLDGSELESDQRLQLAALLGELRRLSEEAKATTEKMDPDEDAQALDAKTEELEKKFDALAPVIKQLADFMAKMLGGGGAAVANAPDEKKAELKEMHSQIRDAARRARQSNASAIANVQYSIKAYERRLKKLERSGAGGSTVVNQTRENVEELKKSLVGLEQQKGRILLSKREADSEYAKSNRRPSSGLLSFFTSPEISGEIQLKRLQKSAYKMEEINNELADVEAVATTIGTVVSGEGGARDIQAIDQWLAVYRQKSQEASPNPVVYDPGLLRPDGSFRDNTFLRPFPRPPKSVNGGPI